MGASSPIPTVRDGASSPECGASSPECGASSPMRSDTRSSATVGSEGQGQLSQGRQRVMPPQHGPLLSTHLIPMVPCEILGYGYKSRVQLHQNHRPRQGPVQAAWAQISPWPTYQHRHWDAHMVSGDCLEPPRYPQVLRDNKNHRHQFRPWLL